MLKFDSCCRRLRRLRRFQSERSGEAQDDVEMHEPEEEQETFDVSPRFILIFVVLMCGMLVSLYFLYDYLGTVPAIYFLCHNIHKILSLMPAVVPRRRCRAVIVLAYTQLFHTVIDM